MKPVRLSSLRDLLETTAFDAWWRRWQAASSALLEARLRRADLAAQAELMGTRAELAQRAGADALSRSREAETAGGAGVEHSLVAAERGVLALRVRREAERLFAEAEERRVRARQLSADAAAAERDVRDGEARLEALRGAARDAFGCAAGVAFLYWGHEDDERSAFAVSLSDADGLDLPVKALGIYVVGRQRGVAALGVPPSA